MNESYLGLLERQARRGFGLLPDRGRDVERNQRDFERRRVLATAFGDWIAKSLGPWDWFINPITFRDRHPDLERNPETGKPRIFRATSLLGPVRLFAPDPRLKGWKPDFRGRFNPGPPVPDKALAEIKDFLLDIQEAAKNPIRWMIAEEFGGVCGRYHCHVLVAGVKHLQRKPWWQIAFERFGRTNISRFDPEKGGAFYAAKYASKRLGGIYFGGPLPGAKFQAMLTRGPNVEGVGVLRSADLSREEFRRLEFHPRGLAGWRSKR
ncbi:MAG: hypothetical protein WA664_18010 [Candidatus Acidiferrales bacterium]